VELLDYEKKIIHLIREFHSIEDCYRKIIFSHHKPVNEKSIQEFQEIKDRFLKFVNKNFHNPIVLLYMFNY